MIAAGMQVAPRFSGLKADRVRAAHRNAHHLSRVPVDARGNVGGHHGHTVVSSNGIDGFDQGGRIPRHRPSQARAEQGVHQQFRLGKRLLGFPPVAGPLEAWPQLAPGLPVVNRAGRIATARSATGTSVSGHPHHARPVAPVGQ